MDIAQARRHIAALDAAAEHRSVPFLAGRLMHWRIFGKGDPPVLIHGGHGSWLHWIRNIEALAQHHTVLVPSLPGYGPELARVGLVNGTPNRDCHVVPAGGHWIQFERADVVNPLLTRWFATTA